jgi:hypothetical protein
VALLSSSHCGAMRQCHALPLDAVILLTACFRPSSAVMRCDGSTVRQRFTKSLASGLMFFQ